MRIDTSLPSGSCGEGRAPVHAVLQLLNHALRQLADADVVDRDACARYIAQALHIHRKCIDPTPAPRTAAGLAAWQVRQVNEIALAHLDAPLAITELASACRLSRGYFTRAFKTTFGESPHRWRHAKRIEHARTRLTETAEPIAGIAVACGFNDQAHFTRAFKAAVGMTPNTYRKIAGSAEMQSNETVVA